MASIVEAEQQLIVNVLNGKDINVRPQDLAGEAHRIILEAAKSLRNEGVTPDLITINNRLQEAGNIDKAGGQEYLTRLAESRPAVNIEPSEEIVRRAALRKRVVNHAEHIIQEAEKGASAEDLLVKAQKESLSLDVGSNRGEIKFVHDRVFDVLDEIEATKRSGAMTGVETPFYKLNDYTQGLQPSDLITVAGRPSMGKTAFATQLAVHCIQRTGPVFVGSLEMDDSSLIKRMLSSEARVDGNLLRSGRYNERQYERIQNAAERFMDYNPLMVVDEPRLSAVDLRILMLQAHATHPLSLAIVDYLGLMKDDGNVSRHREVGENARIMRSVARELKIPVILVCQLNRSCEFRENKRPLLSDLRESGEIEQDSDIVLFLYRDEYYCPHCGSDNPQPECMSHTGVAEVLLRKQRKGATGSFPLTWSKEYTRFDNHIHRSEDED